jgi:hypothetical protein
MLLEMSKINYDYLLTEIILLCNSQRINGFLFFIFVKYYGVEGFGLGIKIHWLHIHNIYTPRVPEVWLRK